jgi:hypothetical protein
MYHRLSRTARYRWWKPLVEVVVWLVLSFLLLVVVVVPVDLATGSVANGAQGLALVGLSLAILMPAAFLAARITGRPWRRRPPALALARALPCGGAGAGRRPDRHRGDRRRARPVGHTHARRLGGLGPLHAARPGRRGRHRAAGSRRGGRVPRHARAGPRRVGPPAVVRDPGLERALRSRPLAAAGGLRVDGGLRPRRRLAHDTDRRPRSGDRAARRAQRVVVPLRRGDGPERPLGHRDVQRRQLGRDADRRAADRAGRRGDRGRARAIGPRLIATRRHGGGAR